MALPRTAVSVLGVCYFWCAALRSDHTLAHRVVHKAPSGVLLRHGSYASLGHHLTDRMGASGCYKVF
jgi:hypothetical protein